MEQRNSPLPIGLYVSPLGEITAVGTRGGERYYMLLSRFGSVSLMPGPVLEEMAAADSASADSGSVQHPSDDSTQSGHESA